MDNTINYYDILGVTEAATESEIKRAYRKMARDYHPDRNPDKSEAEERFKEIQSAYDVIGDPKRRAEYDRMRKDPFAGARFDGFHQGARDGNSRFYRAPDGTYVRMETTGAGPDAGFIFNDGRFDNLGDLFGGFYGGGRTESARHGRTASADLESHLRLPFEQALVGGQTEIKLPDGQTVRLDIPPGVDTGSRIRLKGRGRPGPAGARGDLYITFEVEPHPVFRREGTDLYVKTRLNALEAILGTAKTILTPYGGTVKVTVPAGAQPGERFRVRGQGVRTDTATGDLYVEMDIEIPRELNEEARRKLLAWAEAEGLLPEAG